MFRTEPCYQLGSLWDQSMAKRSQTIHQDCPETGVLTSNRLRLPYPKYGEISAAGFTEPSTLVLQGYATSSTQHQREPTASPGIGNDRLYTDCHETHSPAVRTTWGPGVSCFMRQTLSNTGCFNSHTSMPTHTGGYTFGQKRHFFNHMQTPVDARPSQLVPWNKRILEPKQCHIDPRHTETDATDGAVAKIRRTHNPDPPNRTETTKQMLTFVNPGIQELNCKSNESLSSAAVPKEQSGTSGPCIRSGNEHALPTVTPALDDTEKRRHACIVCDQVLSTKTNLKRHMLIHTGVLKYKCGICEKKFSTQKSLSGHIRTHSNDKPYQCDICGARVSCKEYLMIHVLTIHGGIKRTKCEECNRHYYPTLGGYDRHAEKYHVGEDYKLEEKEIRCSVCDALCKSNRALRFHGLVHLDERPHVCVVCDKAFKRKGTLRLHYNTHTDNRSECNICQKKVRVNGMYSHMKSHGEKKYCCNTCGKRFGSKQNLSTHEKIHLAVRAHACELCDKRFTLPHQLRAHRKTHSVSESKKSK